MPTVLFDTMIHGLGRALSLHHRRHEILATNLANVETPGYRAQELDFRSTLRAAFEPEQAEPRPPVEPRVIEDPTIPARPDGNTVDLDMQMARLAHNGGTYVALARILGRRFEGLRRAIESGR